MKTLLHVAAIAAAIAFAAPAQADSGGLRYSITVAKFENKSAFPEGQFALAQTFSAVLTDSLQQTGRFIVLGEKDMRVEAIAEQDFAASGRVAAGNKRPETGQMTPAQLLVKGEITHFQQSTGGGKSGITIKGITLGAESDTAAINAVIYVVDSTTGQVVASRKVKGEASRMGMQVGISQLRDVTADLSAFKQTNVGAAVEKAIDEAVGFIVGQLERIPWEGSVILVAKDGKVYINRGSREGVTRGQTFTVGTADRLRDPNTGEVLDVTMEKVGTIVVEQVRDKISIGKATEGAANIQRGMSVLVPSDS
jgi:curli biogenesis system outer membrane secretion channel CsgG